MRVEVLDHYDELAGYTGEWDELAGRAIEPNVFYEPWMLLPALREYGGLDDCGSLRERSGANPPKIVLVFAIDPAFPDGVGKLRGVFPVQWQPAYKGVRFPSLTLWKYDHCYLCTPLLSPEYTKDVLSAFVGWAIREPNTSLVEFQLIASDGPVSRILSEFLAERGLLHDIPEQFKRAFFLTSEVTGPEALPARLSSKSKRELRRKKKRLAEFGDLKYIESNDSDDPNTWANDYLALEADGWKGEAGTALACNDRDAAYFREITAGAFKRGKLFMSSLLLNGKPVAIQCAFTSGHGAFTFKTAFDEDYAQCSPGVLMQLQTMNSLAGFPRIEWIDSCTVAANTMANRLTTQRRGIETVLICTGGVKDRLFFLLLRFARKVKRRLGSRAKFHAPAPNSPQGEEGPEVA